MRPTRCEESERFWQSCFRGSKRSIAEETEIPHRRAVGFPLFLIVFLGVRNSSKPFGQCVHQPQRLGGAEFSEPFSHSPFLGAEQLRLAPLYSRYSSHPR